MAIKFSFVVKAQPWHGHTGAGEVHTFNAEFMLPDGANAHVFGEHAGPAMDELYARIFATFGIEAAATIEDPAADVGAESAVEEQVNQPVGVQDRAGA